LDTASKIALAADQALNARAFSFVAIFRINLAGSILSDNIKIHETRLGL